ncbi:magnesium transporter CorA family protein [Clostridium amazonitimonense]|uniref:magnesium transporter CorA family protein n=1 Tax=Clostridium amazonitimonense TaxID=1499689 RepID=UPI00050943ED|nr:CorA family divalent cation transporter [Clostridium amazonitimonense]
MGIVLYKDGKIEKNKTYKDVNNEDAVLYLTDSYEDIFTKRNSNINFSRDVEIKDKNKIVINMPYVDELNKRRVEAVLEEGLLSLYFKEKGFIEFIEEKISRNREFDYKTVFLSLFQFLMLRYDEKLIKLEDNVELRFEEAVAKDSIQLESLLKDKKKIYMIKRCTNYYKSILIYLEDEFEDIKLYNKLFFSFEDTLNLAENVESSIYSCIDIYNSIYSNRMNKTMELLTFITVMLLPASILSGIFGMNFKFMPLLENPQGFYITLAIMMFAVVVGVFYLRKNKKY